MRWADLHKIYELRWTRKCSIDGGKTAAANASRLSALDIEGWRIQNELEE